MSRRIRADYQKLIDFFEGYALGKFEEDQKIDCKALHKKLFALMVFVSDDAIEFSRIQPGCQYLYETVSDAMLSIFCWANGTYKSSKLHLRCMIENLLKALLSKTNPEVIYEKKVYAIFDMAKADIHFKSLVGIDILSKLKNNYAILCETVHSVPEENVPINALKHLPTFDIEKSNQYVELYLSSINAILEILYLNYYEPIHKMHPENCQDFLSCLSPTQKRRISDTLFPPT